MAHRYDFVRDAHERAALMKIMNVRRDGIESAVRFVVDANRGSQHVATFLPATSAPMLRAIRLAVSAFGCDLVAGSADTYQLLGEPSAAAHSGRHLDTGRPWTTGDLRRAFEAGRPWVREGLSTHAVDRVERQVYLMGQAYQWHGRRIVWDPIRGPFTDGEGHRAIGAVPNALRDALSAPDVLARVNHQTDQASCSLTPAERRAYTDVAALRVCAQIGLPVLYDVADPAVRKAVEALLARDSPEPHGTWP